MTKEEKALASGLVGGGLLGIALFFIGRATKKCECKPTLAEETPTRSEDTLEQGSFDTTDYKSASYSSEPVYHTTMQFIPAIPDVR